MDEIGLLLKTTREESGVSLEEASSDLKINELILQNIEFGKIGCFKDIFELKENIRKYGKYLGLDSEKIIDEFNDYMFEYTSKIPIKEIERAILEKEKIEGKEKRVVSPYTKEKVKDNTLLLYVIFSSLVIIIIVIMVIIIKIVFFN